MNKQLDRERDGTIFEEFIACDNPTKWLAIVVRNAKKFGLNYVTLLRWPKTTDRFLSPLAVVSNLPSKLMQYFDQLDLTHQSPVLAKMHYSMLPQVWTLDEIERAGSLPESLIEAFKEFNILCGAAFSFTAPNGERFILAYDGNQPDLNRHYIAELLMLSLTAFDHFQNMRRNSLSVVKTLTKREIEVVRWTAQGKTSSEIASILSLSDHTVNAYMNNAIKKLECVNRTQLVAKAIRLKIIS